MPKLVIGAERLPQCTPAVCSCHHTEGHGQLLQRSWCEPEDDVGSVVNWDTFIKVFEGLKKQS